MEVAIEREVREEVGGFPELHSVPAIIEAVGDQHAIFLARTAVDVHVSARVVHVAAGLKPFALSSRRKAAAWQDRGSLSSYIDQPRAFVSITWAAMVEIGAPYIAA
jgi:hypothetical protein